MFLFNTLVAALGVVALPSKPYAECHWTDKDGSVCAQNTTTFPTTCIPYCAPFTCDGELKDACQALCPDLEDFSYQASPICYIACDITKLEALPYKDLENLGCTELKCCWRCISDPVPTQCYSVTCNVADCELEFPVEDGFFPQKTLSKHTIELGRSGFLNYMRGAVEACNSTGDVACTLIREIVGDRWPIPWQACDCRGEWYKPEADCRHCGRFWALTLWCCLLALGVFMSPLFEIIDSKRKTPKQTKQE